jgi:D-alanyl-D-alanine carboxypeptidase
MSKCNPGFGWLLAVLLAVRAASAQTIPDQIDSILAGPAVTGNSWSILVENADGSTIYYQRNPTTGLAPASNTKMFTTAAAFGLLGTNYAFQTRIHLGGTLASGTLTGNLNLVCEHDPTWNTSTFASARTPLDTIAARLKVLGLTNVVGNVQCYGCCFYNLGSTDASNHDAPNQLAYNSSAATAFVAALAAQGISVSGSAVGQTGFNVPGTLFHTHYSTNLTYGGQPLRLDVACIPLMKPSHNVMADALLRHIGWKLTGTDSFAAGRNQVLPWLRNVAGLTTNGIVMNDGSGLSHGNRFSARQTVSLTRYMLGAFPTWDDTLPIGCVDGTLGSRFCGTDGSGKLHGKTGSLSISISLSGYIDNPYDNQRYLFSFTSNDSGGIDQTATRSAIDAAVVLFGGRGVPLGPELLRVASQPDGSSLQLTWSDEKFIRTGYQIYASSNGVNFNAPISVGPAVQSYTDSGLTPGTQRYYKVTVVGSGGESKASRIYGAQVGGAPRVLIVDGNDRWQFLPAENPTCTNHGFAAITGQSISGAAFETAHHNAVIDGSVALTNYPAVVWLMGEESTADETFSTTEQSLVTGYLNAGGNLFVSGAEVGWDLDRVSGPTTADRNFYRTVLRAAYNADDSATYAFVPTINGAFLNDSASGFDNGTKGTYNVDYPDVLTPTNGSVVALTYSGGTGGTAAVQYDGALGGGKVMNWGFPFETITNSFTRTAYMSDVLRFFNVLDAPQLLAPQINPAGSNLTLAWSGSVGLRYRVQYKTNLTDSLWQNLPGDVVATNLPITKLDSLPTGPSQRFYRVMLLD